MVKKVGKYEIGKTLGEGTFGKVKYAVNTETDERVAIKVLDKEKIQKQNMGNQIKKEISIMKMIRHSHVVVLKEVLASRTKIFIVLELITGGELFDKIVSEGRFNEATARFYFRQLVSGVHYCHSQGVAHRDLKPENLLLDENGDLKISDFGLSALYDGGSNDDASSEGTTTTRASLLHTTCGTPNYVAPEVLADKGYDGRAADVWSIGVILYVLLAGFLPFDEPTMSALFRKIQKAEFSYPSWFTPPLKDLLNSILNPDPTKRVTLEQIQADPWYTEGESNSILNLNTNSSTNNTSTENQDGRLKVQPSQADMDAAIQETSNVNGGTTTTDTTNISSSTTEEDEDGTGAEDGSTTTAPRVMNAFDLINMCGGLALNRMFNADTNNNTRGRIAHSTHFTSNMSLEEIKSAITNVLTELKCEVSGGDTAKVKATLSTPKGEVGVILQVYVLASELYFVEVRRGKGDIFEYHKFHTELNERLSQILTPTGAENQKS